MIKKGDTLIEVTLAVGIFSMVAIAIVAVMSGGTSSAQTALETTLAREEIDAQAEALRFIQSSYIASKDTSEAKEDVRYAKLWEDITARAITNPTPDILQFTPSSCEDLYKNGEVFQGKGAFILNYRNLGSFTPNTTDSVLIPALTNDGAKSDRFVAATTYPRLIYTDRSTGAAETDTGLVTDTENYKFYRAEGIYVIAVRDNKTTGIIDGNRQSSTSAFYDFYIRTCWYGTDASRPSTISTVIRLYDPNAIKSSK